MAPRVSAFVYSIAVAAVIAFTVLWRRAPDVEAELVLGALGLVLLGAYTAVTKYKTSRSSSGEVSFIPYLSAVMIYPHWSTVALIGIAVTAVELGKKKHYLKQLFNSAQFLLATTLSAIAYVALGGISLASDSGFQLLPHSAGVVTFLLVNACAVAIVIALVEKKNVVRVIIDSNRSSLLYDLFAIPGVYGVARAYTDWSWWGLLVTVALLYGVRLMYQAKLQLENTNRELLELFVHTVEFRDPYTSGHSQRVSRLSRIIARIIGLSSKEIDRIGKAALLHDVGKIHAVFEPILSKPGKLTEEERAIMELHPIKSAELVSKLSDFDNIVPDVRHHHENYDGTGYPDRLVGKDIPLGSRIIMFADTIDAMTTDRPYRPAMDPLKVRDELIRCRGQQFDPDICDALLSSPDFNSLFTGIEGFGTPTFTQIFDRVRKPRTPATV